MGVPKLRTTEFVNLMAGVANSVQSSSHYDGQARGTVRAIIKDVNDPENRGRVRVIFDDMNPDIPQRTGSGEYSQEREAEPPELSHWIDISPAFNGKQPQGLLDTRVNVAVSNGQYQFAVLQDVLYDPQNLTDKAGSKLKKPNNSTMTRLPIYGSGSLPPASEENHGCMVVESGGPMQSDWMCVCLKRNGSYVWVRHIDLAHGHAGQNDSVQRQDSDGDSQQPVNNMTVWDFVFPTTAGAMAKQSDYGSDPRGNPFGGAAKHYGGAK